LYSAIHVYSVPGFVGATLDQTASHVADSYASWGGVSLTTPGGLSAVPEFALGVVNWAQSPSSASHAYQYTLPSGGHDISPQVVGRNIIACSTVNSMGPVTFQPSWDSGTGYPTVTLLATFKTFNRTSFNPSNWHFIPKWPIHLAHIGIGSSTTADIQVPLQNFGRYLSTVVLISFSW
jgi:hypothetical protein